jgi:hypothetical protein
VGEIMKRNPKMGYYNTETDVWTRIVANILKFYLANNQNDDKVIWVKSENGDYTVKSAYNTLMSNAETHYGPLSSEEWKFLWKLNVQETEIVSMESSLADPSH